MALVSLRQLLDHAAENNYGVPAFNVNNLDGGDIKETYGVPVEEIVRGIQSGVRKVNIDTDIRLAMTGAMRQSFAMQPGEFDPRKALQAATKAARGICEARFKAFGCEGMAARIKPIALDAMVARYR